MFRFLSPSGFLGFLLTAVLLCFPEPAAAKPLRIILDYRFDGGYFSDHEERRIPLEYAAGLWEEVLKSPRSIPGGTKFQLRKNFTTDETTTIEVDETIDAFVIFVYAHDFAKEVDKAGRPAPSKSKAVGGNFGGDLSVGFLAINTNAGRPWYFDSTPETEYDVPVKTYCDLITTSVHEIGHVLGFLRGRQEPFVRSYGEKDERFSGPAALRVNSGNPVPLDFGSSHIRGDWWNDNYLPLPPIDRHVMHTGDPVQGYRQLMTAIDLAVMEDIGWEVDYDAIPAYPYAIREDERKTDLESNFGISKSTLNPVGLWLFDTRESAGSAIIGRPLRFSPPDGATGRCSDLFRNREIREPKGGWLYCVPGLKANGSGGTTCNRYTMLFDVNLPAEGVFYCLWNTNPDNLNDGECFINPDGRFGVGTGGYSTEKIEAGKWYRLGIVVDADAKTRRYYINGKFSHEVRDVETDGRFAINSASSPKPYFCLFGDNDGEDASIDARRVILYDTALSDARMKQLGDSSNLRFGL